MAYRLTNIAGFELTLNMDDRARSSRLWQYFLKPVAHSISAAKAGINGALASLAPAQAVVEKPTEAVLSPTPEQARILNRIQNIARYHTIDLGHGVRTPGRFNHYPLLKDYSLPESLSGMRCLDVATMNGFWAFQMERLGAREVVALDVEKLGDLDIPPLERTRMSPEELSVPRGTGFLAAKEILNSAWNESS